MLCFNTGINVILLFLLDLFEPVQVINEGEFINEENSDSSLLQNGVGDVANEIDQNYLIREIKNKLNINIKLVSLLT